MLNSDDLKFAVGDMNTRLTALVDLTKFNDQQAMSLLSLYVTLGIASIGGALSGVGDAPLIGAPPAVGLAAFAVVIFIGAVTCHRAMLPSNVALPGKGVDYWQYVKDTDEFSMEDALRRYIDDAAAILPAFRKVHDDGAALLTSGRRLGLYAVAVGGVFGAITALIGWGSTGV